MALDLERYDREVIRPLRRKRGRLGEDDLLRRYAIEPGMSGDQLRAHLRALRTYWNQKASGADSRAQVCKLLLVADEELQRRVGAALEDPAWWREQAERSNRQAMAAVEQLASDLNRAYGAVGQISRGQLARTVEQHYPSLSQSHVDEAVRQARLRVIDAVELPASSGLDKASYKNLNSRLREIDAQTIVALLHPDLDRPFTLAREFSVPGGPALSLDARLVDARLAAEEKAADSAAVRARKAALRILRSGLDAGADLRTVALFQIVEQLAAERAEGLADAMLERRAIRAGLAPEDAALVVASLPSTIETGSPAAAAVRELLADGQLRSAEQALAAVPATDPERVDVETAVKSQLAELQRLLDGVDTAVAQRRDAEAERLLRQAGRLAADDSELAARLLRLPLPPPREVSAVPAQAAIRLAWQPPDSGAEDVRYQVVRAKGRPPASPHDGTTVAATPATTATDGAPPAADELHYAVFATGNQGTTWSRPATATARLVPPLTGIRLHAFPTEVTASWTAHPSVVEVRVRRTRHRAPTRLSDGVAVRATAGSFVDRDIREGEEYFYGLVAVYHDQRGQEVLAPMAVVSAVPRAAAKPVEGMTVTPLAVNGDRVRIRLTWPAAAGQVRVRYASRLPSWQTGDVVAEVEIEQFGREVPGTPMVDGGRSALDAEVPAGPHVYVPFAIGGTGAVVGKPVALGLADPVRQLHARRTGGDVVLTWIWPPGVRLAEVAWAAPDREQPEVRRVSHSQYVDGEGCLLPVGPGGGTATVRAVSIGPVGESYSAPAMVTVDGRAIGLSYVLRQVGWQARLARLSRRRVVEVTADQDCAGIDLVVVVSEGMVMPISADQGTVVDRFNGLRLRRGTPVPLEVELPPKLRRPYWIRCFVTYPATVTMVDPPVAELKVD